MKNFISQVLLMVTLTTYSFSAVASIVSADNALTNRDYAVALSQNRQASDGGSAEATFNLGLMYQQGLGVEQNISHALKLYRKAYSLGSGKAAVNIGVIFAAEQDYSNAIVWFKRAISKGQVSLGAHGAGSCYLEMHNYTEAFKYYLMAAKAGSPYSQYQVGLAYWHGRGAKQDLQQAYNWLYRAKVGGSDDAATAFSHLLATLSPAQIQKLQAASS